MSEPINLPNICKQHQQDDSECHLQNWLKGTPRRQEIASAVTTIRRGNVVNYGKVADCVNSAPLAIAMWRSPYHEFDHSGRDGSVCELDLKEFPLHRLGSKMSCPCERDSYKTKVALKSIRIAEGLCTGCRNLECPLGDNCCHGQCDEKCQPAPE